MKHKKLVSIVLSATVVFSGLLYPFSKTYASSSSDWSSDSPTFLDTYNDPIEHNSGSVISKVKSSTSETDKHRITGNSAFTQHRLNALRSGGTDFRTKILVYDEGGGGYTQWFDSPFGQFLAYEGGYDSFSNSNGGISGDRSHDFNIENDSVEYSSELGYGGHVAYVAANSSGLGDAKSASILAGYNYMRYPLYITDQTGSISSNTMSKLRNNSMSTLVILGGNGVFEPLAGASSASDFNIIRTGGYDADHTRELMTQIPNSEMLNPSHPSGDSDGIVMEGVPSSQQSTVNSYLESEKSSQDTSSLVSAAQYLMRQNQYIGSSYFDSPEITIGVHTDTYEVYYKLYYNSDNTAFAYQFIMPQYFKHYGDGGDNNNPDPTPPVHVNHAPTINPISDQTVHMGSTADITAKGSDQDGDALTFHWTGTDASGKSVFDHAGPFSTQSTAYFKTTDTPVNVSVYCTDPSGASSNTVTGKIYVTNNPPRFSDLDIFDITKGYYLDYSSGDSDNAVYSVHQGDKLRIEGNGYDIDGYNDYPFTWHWSLPSTIKMNNFTQSVQSDDFILGSDTINISNYVTDVWGESNNGKSNTKTAKLVPVNTSPTASLNIPSNVTIGNDFILDYDGEDQDNDHIKTKWTLPDNTLGTTPTDVTDDTTYGDTGYKKVYFDAPTDIGKDKTFSYTVTDEFGKSTTVSKTVKVVAPSLSMNIDVKPSSDGGALKQNRKVTATASALSNSQRDSFDWTTATYTITDASGKSSPVKLQDVSNGKQTFNFACTDAGTYKIAGSVKDKYGLLVSTSSTFNISRDIAPIAGLTVPKTYVRDPNNNNNAIMTATDKSSSTDGDSINARLWFYAFDANNNGTYADDTWYAYYNNKWNVVGTMSQAKAFDPNTVSLTNATTASVTSSHVGKYDFEVKVREKFGQTTIPSIDPEKGIISSSF